MGGSALASAATKGSGASFPRLAYQAWCQDSALCSYESKGSTGGINDFIAGTTDWGASDAPLTSEQLGKLAAQRSGVTPLYFPTLLGAVTFPTNLPGQTGPLQLQGLTIAKIFAGEITNWNNPAISKDNIGNPRLKGFKFPDRPIIVCVRQDGSGTSFVASTYLSKASVGFKQKVGASQLPNWTVPAENLQKGAGNPLVANCINTNPGSIGYVDLGDALASGLASKAVAVGRKDIVVRKRKVRVRGKVKVVKVKVPGIAYYQPTVGKIQAALPANATLPQDLVLDLTNTSARGAYPVSTTTWVLAYSSYTQAGKAARAAEVRQTLNYFYSEAAQAKLPSLGFAPLPPLLKSRALSRLALIQ